MLYKSDSCEMFTGKLIFRTVVIYLGTCHAFVCSIVINKTYLIVMNQKERLGLYVFVCSIYNAMKKINKIKIDT